MRFISKLAAIVAFALLTTGCKIVSIEQDQEARERRSASFDAEAHVGRIWASQVLPGLEGRAVAAPELAEAVRGRLDRFAARHGRQAGEGSPWTFSVRGEATVTEIDRTSRRGTIGLVLADGTPVTLQTGPVIVDAALRDALPIFNFNDFADQLAFAKVSRALTDRALGATAPVASHLSPGDRVRFLGVARISAGEDALTVLPVRLEVAG
jgi:predicted lipoprotein